MFLVEFDVVQYVRRTAVGPVMSLHTLCLARWVSLSVAILREEKHRVHTTQLFPIVRGFVAPRARAPARPRLSDEDTPEPT